jgi:hypothetical protein
MITRSLKQCSPIVVVLITVFSIQAAAQAPAAPPKVYTGSIGGGLALTRGNTDTGNFNLTANLTHDPKTRNVIKGSVLYLRGSQNDILSVDRTSVNLRDEYTVSGRTFVFGQVDYLRDRFKDIIYLWVPAGGIGYKLINTDATQLIVDGSAGGLAERNPGLPVSKSGSLTAGQRFQQKVSTAATITESFSSIFKTKDFEDSLTTFSLGLSTTLVGKLELKLEFIDIYKNKPTKVTLKKNDTAFVTSFVMKF